MPFIKSKLPGFNELARWIDTIMIALGADPGKPQIEEVKNVIVVEVSLAV